MTFTEAAVEVLRLVGKPLHYKKITEIAIERNLLSHVGKTPEVTMSSRLATMVKKDRGEAPIIKVKPGVFGLRDFAQDVIAQAETDTGLDYELPEGEAVQDESETEGAGENGAAETGAAAGAPSDVRPVPVAKKPALPGQEVFPEEEDDDEPILANLDKDEGGEEGGAGEGAGGGRRRRRRRRKGRGGEELEVGAGPAAAPVEGAGGGPAPGERPSVELRPGWDRDRGGRDRDRDRGGRDRDRDRGADRDRGRDRDRGGGGDRDRFDRGRPEPIRGDWNREPDDGELVGKDLADSVFAVLSQGGDRSPLPFHRVADLLVRKGRLQGDPALLAPTVASAIRADGARRAAEQMRPRFRLEGGARVSLTDWAMPRDALRFEQDAVRAADRQRDQVRRAFLRKLSELPAAAFVELVATWLNAEGVVALRAVRRPGSPPGELNLAGTLRRGHDEMRIGVVVARGDIGREKVIEARGALHHYGGAAAAWLVTIGQVLSGAREEAASAPGSSPVALHDGIGLARAMEKVGVGLMRHTVRLSTMDFDLLETLRGGQEPRRDLDRDRGADRPAGQPVREIRLRSREAAAVTEVEGGPTSEFVRPDAGAQPGDETRTGALGADSAEAQGAPPDAGIGAAPEGGAAATEAPAEEGETIPQEARREERELVWDDSAEDDEDEDEDEDDLEDEADDAEAREDLEGEPEGGGDADTDADEEEEEDDEDER